MFGAGSEGNDVLSLRQLNRAESPSGAMADARRISTSLTRAFPSMTVPLVGAPMDGASCGELAAGTARGGALGFIAGGSVEENGEKLAREVAIYRSKAPPGAPLCIGYIEQKCVDRGGGSFNLILESLDEHRPDCVQLFAPCSDELLGAIEARYPGTKILAQVGSVREARRVIAAGVWGVICQGREAGGHGLRAEMGCGTLALARRVVQIADAAEATGARAVRPVILAAGGLVDGSGLAAALCLGCDGAVMGTRLWATHESLGSAAQKRALQEAENDDAVRTRVYDIIGNQLADVPWRYPYDSCGVLCNEHTHAYENREEDLSIQAKAMPKESLSEAKKAFTLSGEGVGSIATIGNVQEVIEEVRREASVALTLTHIRISPPLPSPSPSLSRADWDGMMERLAALLDGEGDLVSAMATVTCEVMHLGAGRFSWVGFYRWKPQPAPGVLIVA